MLACKNFGTYLTSYRKYHLIPYGSVQNVNINDPSFDGFVIPNGATFTCGENDFKEACAKYSSTRSEKATSFTVPNLT